MPTTNKKHHTRCNLPTHRENEHSELANPKSSDDDMHDIGSPV